MKKSKIFIASICFLNFLSQCLGMDDSESKPEKLLKTINNAGAVRRLIYIPEENLIISDSFYRDFSQSPKYGKCPGKDKLIFWDVSGQKKQETEIPREGGLYLPGRKEYIVPKKKFCSIDYIPEKHQIIVGKYDGNIKLIDLATQKVVKIFPGYKESCKCIYLKDRQQILSIAGYNGINPFQLWDLNSGTEIAFDCNSKFPYGGSLVLESLTYLEDQQQIAGSSYYPDCTLQIWDLNSGEIVQRFSGHRKAVMCFAYLKTKKQLISGSADLTMKLWDLKSGKELDTFHGHRASISSIVDMADLQQVASGSADGTIKIWDLSQHSVN